MTDDEAHRRLIFVPEALRDRLVSVRDEVPFGALLAVGRFYKALRQRGEQADAPSAGTFAEVCRSKTSLNVLLRTLSRYHPGGVCLAEGRQLSKAYYQDLMQRGAGPQPKPARGPSRDGSLKARGWLDEWLALLPGLLGAPLRPTTIVKHLQGINRCADHTSGLTCPPRFSWLFAWELARALEADGMARITVADKLGSLIALGRYGGLPSDRLEGLHRVQASLRNRARMDPRVKVPRIRAFTEHGGYAEVIGTIVRLLDRAEAEPDWSAAAERARATAAILMVTVNVPPRSADAGSWRLGHEIEREPWGEWLLTWSQRKTGAAVDVGRLWPETAAVLDQHLLGGRPPKLAVQRYDDLRGKNWLRLVAETPHHSWPSRLVKAALGIPLHDVRTLAADQLRAHDPGSAPEIIRALLGHRTLAAGENFYRAVCHDDVATRRWQAIRDGLEWNPVLSRSAMEAVSRHDER